MVMAGVKIIMKAMRLVKVINIRIVMIVMIVMIVINMMIEIIVLMMIPSCSNTLNLEFAHRNYEREKKKIWSFDTVKLSPKSTADTQGKF